jgi:arylsulfatase A-like enzyme
MVGVNLARMPVAAFLLLAPSAIALVFLSFVLAKPAVPLYDRRGFARRAAICVAIIVAALLVRPVVPKRGSTDIASAGLGDNSQLRAVMSLVLPDPHHEAEPQREVPSCDQSVLTAKPAGVTHNVVVVVLEGIQYRYTSLADEENDLTPYLARLAEEGIEFPNTRSSLTHTTKALFALFTGRFPSASQDLAEAVPVPRPYASMATVLRSSLGYRTAFFQSAMGSFEARPGLVHNLGFDKFWAREDVADPNAFLGYLGCDEFSMLEPVCNWIKAGAQPFFLTILCSASHDPYEVPAWFGTPANDPIERYRQVISYTDTFLAALDVELANLGLTDNTIFCVVGDHGEAFGEHGRAGHERIPFDEVLHVPFCLRAPLLLEPGGKVADPAGSVDLTPTLLSLLGFDTASAGFDGRNLCAPPSQQERRVYFCGWMQEGPAGFVEGSRKLIYDPTSKTASIYDLSADPGELARIEVPGQEAEEIADQIAAWRTSTVIKIRQQRTGKELLFGQWLCDWRNRVSSARYAKKERQ